MFFIIVFICVYISLFFYLKLPAGAVRFAHYRVVDVILSDLLFLIVSWGFLAYGFKLNRQRCMIQDIPASKVESIAMGIVELNGKIKKIYDLVSPLAKMQCVFYRYIIEVLVRNSKGGDYWKEVSRIESKLPFYLEDETGKVLVDPIDIDLNFEYRSRQTESSRRHTEWFIMDREDVFLVGAAKKSKDCVTEFQNRLNDELVKLKHDPERLKTFDINKDGNIDPEEWDKAVEQVKTEVEKEEAGQPEIDPLADIVIDREPVNDIFLISDASEKELVSKMFWKSAGAILAGFGIFAYSIIYILPRVLGR